MAPSVDLLQFLIVGLVVKNVCAVPVSSASLSPTDALGDAEESKLVEIKLPVKITSMEDLIAWARNAMRSMASRIDITLATVDDAPPNPSENPLSTNESNSKQKKSKNAENVDRRPIASAGALVSTYASLLGPGNTFGSISQTDNRLIDDVSIDNDNDLPRDVFTARRIEDFTVGALPRANLNAYLPLLLDDSELSRYREEALKNYYLESEEGKREESRKDAREKNSKYSQHTRAMPISMDDTRPDVSKKNVMDEKKLTPVISVPFEAIVTITRENSHEPTHATFMEIRDPPDEFPPYFTKVYPRPDAPDTGNTGKRTTDSSQKQQIATLGDLLRTLGITKRVSNKNQSSAANNLSSKAKKPSQSFTPPAQQYSFEDESQRPRKNDTSQRQELDDDDEEEESMGSLGSITDLLPLVLPILEDIIDPNTETDLGEVLGAALPLIQGLSEPGDDPDAPDIIGMIGPILTNILGGKDGQGSDVAAILGPLITLVAPLIGPVLGPVIGPLLGASSNPPDAEGSSLATLLNAVIGPLVVPTEKGGMSPLSILTAGIIAALSKELKPGLPGGLDVGAVVGAVLSGVLAGTSAGLSGALSNDQANHQAYGPYPGPIQAGTVNTRTGYIVPGSQVAVFHSPGSQPSENPVEHPTIGQHSTRRPYATLPQRFSSALQPRPQSSVYVQHVQATAVPNGPLQAGTGTNGGSSYLPYGNQAAPANSANPITLIGNAIKEVLGAGVQVVSSVLNVVFGVIGSSSAPTDPRPVYGPPQPAPYSQPQLTSFTNRR